MNKYRWVIHFANLLLILAIVSLGFYFFGGLGLIMQRVIGLDEKYSPDLYFKDAPIPTWNPKDYLPAGKADSRARRLEDYRKIWTKIVVGPIVRPLDNKEDIEPTPEEILYKKVREVRSVVYSRERPEKRGCYLRTVLKNGGEGTYFYTPGDEFHIAYKTGGEKRKAIFEVSAIREIERDRKYEIVFESDVCRSVVKEYVRAVPLAFNIKAQINR